MRPPGRNDFGASGSRKSRSIDAGKERGGGPKARRPASMRGPVDGAPARFALDHLPQVKGHTGFFFANFGGKTVSFKPF